MVSTYELLTELREADKLEPLVRAGVVPITFLDYLTIYERYVLHRKTARKMQSYEDTAQELNVSARTVRIVVQKMEA